MASRGKEEKRDFRLDLADRLIQQIEQCTARWQKPWNPGEILSPVNAAPLISTSGTVSLDGYRCLGPVTVVNLAMYGRTGTERQVDATFQLLRDRLLSMGADAATSVRLVPLNATPDHPAPALMAYGTAWRRDTQPELSTEPELSEDDFVDDKGEIIGYIDEERDQCLAAIAEARALFGEAKRML